MRSAILKSALSVALCSIVAMLAMPTSLSAKERNGNSAKAEANIEDNYWHKRFEELKKSNIAKGLKLLDFEYVGKITSEKQKEAFIKKCLDKNATMMYAPNSRYLRFEVSTVKHIKASKPELYEYFVEHIYGSTDRIKINDAEIVKLKWEYNGKQFETYAAVTNSQLNWVGGGGTIANKRNLEYMIYDNILMPLRADQCKLEMKENGGKSKTLPYFSLS